MTESTWLHIQDRESGPIRVVELPWISVRIGRAAHCEVRLTEHELPDEVCRLQRGANRGASYRPNPRVRFCLMVGIWVARAFSHSTCRFASVSTA